MARERIGPWPVFERSYPDYIGRLWQIDVDASRQGDTERSRRALNRLVQIDDRDPVGPAAGNPQRLLLIRMLPGIRQFSADLDLLEVPTDVRQRVTRIVTEAVVKPFVPGAA